MIKRSTATVIVLVIALISGIVPAASEAIPLSPHCPAGALVDPLGSDPHIRWKLVRSEIQARACIQNLAARLGPEGMRRWFERNGFNSSRQFQSRPEIIFVSTNWPIRNEGLLFWDGVWRSLTNRFAHGMSINVYWSRNSFVNVNIDYTVE